MCDFSQYGTPSAEWLALEPTLPPFPAEMSLPDQQKLSHTQREALAAKGFALLADKLVTADYVIPTRDGSTVPARTYQLKETKGQKGLLPVYMHLHGGGFYFGTIASEDGICARIAVDTGAIVLNVNYRHTDTHPYPTAWHDVQDAFAWLHADLEGRLGGDPARVVVGGISAGGQLTASLTVAQHLATPGCEALAALPRPAGVVLMIPNMVMPHCYAGHAARLADPDVTGSYAQCKDAPLLPVSRIKIYTELLKAQDCGPDDLILNPGNIPPEKAKGMPPATFGIAGLDPLRDGGLLYAKLLAEAGVPTNVNVFKGLPHAYRQFNVKLPHGSKAWDEVMHGGIKWALSNPQPVPFEIKEH
ncbi:hypothetical protein RB594_002471 [Gaeumannomyces avenae]